MEHEISNLWGEIEGTLSTPQPKDMGFEINALLQEAFKTKQPNSILAELHYMAGYWHYNWRFGKTELAALYLAEALLYNPSSLWARLYLGYCHYDMGILQLDARRDYFPHFQQAERHFGEVLEEKSLFAHKDEHWRLISLQEYMACIKVYTLAPDAATTAQQFREMLKTMPKEIREKTGSLTIALKWQERYFPSSSKNE